jgi:gluconolactonase
MSADKFEIHQNEASDLFGQNPKLELLLENERYPFAHEAGVFIQGNNTLFITSNQFSDANGHKTIQISRVTLPTDGSAVVCEEIQPQGVGVPMANGGVNYKDGVLFCAQGNMDELGGLVYMKASPPYETETVISSFHGRPFNSVNDVVVHSDDSIWFTDPIYGHEQGFKPKPRLPCQVYRYDTEKQSIRAMADGFGRPNGICFSPDEETVYVTDTDWMHGDGTSDDARVSSM